MLVIIFADTWTPVLPAPPFWRWCSAMQSRHQLPAQFLVLAQLLSDCLLVASSWSWPPQPSPCPWEWPRCFHWAIRQPSCWPVWGIVEPKAGQTSRAAAVWRMVAVLSSAGMPFDWTAGITYYHHLRLHDSSQPPPSSCASCAVL